MIVASFGRIAAISGHDHETGFAHVLARATGGIDRFDETA
jgi:hypothetical protein